MIWCEATTTVGLYFPTLSLYMNDAVSLDGIERLERAERTPPGVTLPSIVIMAEIQRPKNHKGLSTGSIAKPPVPTISEVLIERPFERALRFPLEDVPGSLPTAEIPIDANLDAAASWALAQLYALDARSFTEDCMWRDLYALTGLPRTFYGSQQILSAWTETTRFHQPYELRLIPNTTRVIEPGPKIAWVAVQYTFRTRGNPPASCSGQISLIPDPACVGQWKIWHFSTVLEHFEGHPTPDKFSDQTRVNNNGSNQELSSSVYDCCVIGAGFAGLCLSARFKALGVNYLTLEKNARVGDNWRHRYRSATCELLPT